MKEKTLQKVEQRDIQKEAFAERQFQIVFLYWSNDNSFSSEIAEELINTANSLENINAIESILLEIENDTSNPYRHNYDIRENRRRLLTHLLLRRHALGLSDGSLEKEFQDLMSRFSISGFNPLHNGTDILSHLITQGHAEIAIPYIASHVHIEAERDELYIKSIVSLAQKGNVGRARAFIETQYPTQLKNKASAYVHLLVALPQSTEQSVYDTIYIKIQTLLKKLSKDDLVHISNGADFEDINTTQSIELAKDREILSLQLALLSHQPINAVRKLNKKAMTMLAGELMDSENVMDVLPDMLEEVFKLDLSNEYRLVLYDIVKVIIKDAQAFSKRKGVEGSRLEEPLHALVKTGFLNSALAAIKSASFTHEGKAELYSEVIDQVRKVEAYRDQAQLYIIKKIVYHTMLAREESIEDKKEVYRGAYEYTSLITGTYSQAKVRLLNLIDSSSDSEQDNGLLWSYIDTINKNDFEKALSLKKEGDIGVLDENIYSFSRKHIKEVFVTLPLSSQYNALALLTKSLKTGDWAIKDNNRMMSDITALLFDGNESDSLFSPLLQSLDWAHQRMFINEALPFLIKNENYRGLLQCISILEKEDPANTVFIAEIRLAMTQKIHEGPVQNIDTAMLPPASTPLDKGFMDGFKDTIDTNDEAVYDTVYQLGIYEVAYILNQNSDALVNIRKISKEVALSGDKHMIKGVIRALVAMHMPTHRLLQDMYEIVLQKQDEESLDLAFWVLNALIKENPAFATDHSIKLLAEDISPRRQAYMLARFVQAGNIPQSVTHFLSMHRKDDGGVVIDAEQPNMPFFRDLITNHGTSAYRIIETLSELQESQENTNHEYFLPDDAMQTNIHTMIQKLGSISKKLFGLYCNKNTPEGKEIFLKQVQLIQEKLLTNTSLDALEDDADNLLTESIVTTYGTNKNAGEVSHMLTQLRDHTADIAKLIPSIHPSYALTLGDVDYELVEEAVLSKKVKVFFGKQDIHILNDPIKQKEREDQKKEAVENAFHNTLTANNLKSGALRMIIETLRKEPTPLLDITSYDSLLQTQEYLTDTLSPAHIRELLANYIHQEGMPEDIANADLAVMVKTIENSLAPLRKDLAEEIKKWEAIPSEASITLEMKPIKNTAAFFALDAAGLCINNDTRLFNDPKFFPFILTQNTSDGEKVMGTVLARVEDVHGKITLIIYGLNPTSKFMEAQSIEPKQFINQVIIQAKGIVHDDAGLSQLAITIEPTTLSNRSSILTELERLIGSGKYKKVKHYVQASTQYPSNKIVILE